MTAPNADLSSLPLDAPEKTATEAMYIAALTRIDRLQSRVIALQLAAILLVLASLVGLFVLGPWWFAWWFVACVMQLVAEHWRRKLWSRFLGEKRAYEQGGR